MRHRRAFVSLAYSIVLGLSACGQNPPPAPPVAPPPGPSAWAQYVDGFLTRYFKAHPPQAIVAGRHEFDGELPDWTDAGLTREIARLHEERAAAAAFDNAALSSSERFERDYLLARIDCDLFWFEVMDEAHHNPAFYLGESDWGDSLDPTVYVMRPYASLEERAKALIRYAKNVAIVAAEIRRNLKTPMPRTFVELGIAGFGGMADFYRNDVPKTFDKVADPKIKNDLLDALQPAANAMQALADWLKGERAHATGPVPLGVERYQKMLSMTERVDVPVAEVERAGRLDLERNLAAVKAACREFAPGMSEAKCFDRVRADKPKGGALDGAREQIATLRQFVIDHKVVSVPSDEQAQVAEAPPFARQNFAYIDIPGPYEKNVPSVYYIAPADPAWSKADRDAYVPGKAILLFTSAHEVWPGHFLQFLHANRVSSGIGRFFVGYAFAEGWAHYAEELMWEEGVATDPETHLGQLSEALLRDVRLLSSIGIHTEGWTVAKSEQMFREQAFQDPGNARQQAARATYDPSYLDYTLGKMMIRRLRADWTESRGGEKAWAAFHDELLSYGGPPLPLVRRAMLGGDKGSLF